MTNFTSGARITLLSQWLRFGIQLVAFVLLARLLTPDQFGVMAMVAVVVAFATLLADSGLTLAGLQAEFLTDQQGTNLFWLNAGAGAFAMVVVALSGPLLALFYNDQRVVLLAMALSVSLLINGLAVQFRVAINRQKRFGVLALQDVLSAASGLLAGAILALNGAGYWALAGQVLAQSLTVLLMAASQASWWPGIPRREAAMRKLVRFGADSLALQVANLLSRSVDVMAIGRVQGPEALGYYSRATQLVAMSFQQLVTPLTRVMLPRLASEASSESFNDTLVRMQRPIVYVLFFVVSLLASLVQPLVVLALGADWAPMGNLVQILCVGATFQAFGYIYYWALLAQAKTGMLLISELPGRLLMIVGAVVCAGGGVTAIAWIISLGLGLIWLLSTTVLAPRAGLDSKRLTLVGVWPAILFLSAFIGASVVGILWFPDLHGTAALPALLWMTVAWVVIASSGLLLPGIRRDVRLLLVDLRGLRP
ncbi:MAG: lipopolysaccharide biosynthesis protein [Microbacterium sp.]|uniref:lipopolysaccharide biosynthesis protein n=1 Tax=Microbacterium sp. TaxID=51671 RepID=UPI00271EE9FC|nr:lipopolysaccharide biosynthesis protein [Microbacterium sp.]MDO8383196.1 lipopolysaccharide biosynthesis protein [Microbacterium sp.]